MLPQDDKIPRVYFLAIMQRLSCDVGVNIRQKKFNVRSVSALRPSSVTEGFYTVSNAPFFILV